MSKAILTLNVGSSSIKFALYEQGLSTQRLVSHGVIEDIGERRVSPRALRMAVCSTPSNGKPLRR